MRCPTCEYENPKDTKFCGKCGAKLEKICSECNSANPPQFNFCGQCGNKLIGGDEPSPNDLSFDERLAKVQKYLPKGLADKILSQKDRIEGERKQVTVMFCDMRGFTSLCETLGPEGAYHAMDQVYEILIQKVHDYEGTVNELTGDGIMALWNGFAQFNLGEIYFDIGEYQKSEKHYNKAICLFEQNRSSPSTANLAKLGLIKTKVFKNEKDVNLESIYDNEYKSNYKIHDGWKARYLGEILLHIDDQHQFESEDWIKIAIKADKKNGMMLHLGKDYVLYAFIFIRINDQYKAKENLCKAIEIFKECGADGWVEKYKKELTKL